MISAVWISLHTYVSVKLNSVSSVMQLCLTLCDHMDCSTPGFPVHHQLLDLVQTHVHQVGDAIEPSHPLLSPFPPTFNLSQHQGLSQGVSSLYQVAKVSSSITSWQTDGETMETVTAAMKLRHRLLGKKAMTNLDSVLKSRDITLPTKVCLVKAVFFPVVMYGCESWTIKKAECQRIEDFELQCWRRLLRVP